jgi:hypothetical protein
MLRDDDITPLVLPPRVLPTDRQPRPYIHWVIQQSTYNHAAPKHKPNHESFMFLLKKTDLKKNKLKKKILQIKA